MRQGLLYLSSEGDHLFEVVSGFRAVPLDTPFDRLTVVTDFVEEALTRVSMPKMGGRDMDALVQRRLQTEFRETPYRDSVKLGPGKAEKTIEYLFIGLPVAQRLDRELKPRVEAGCAVDAVVSISALVAHWIRKAGRSEQQRLVVLPTPAGMRHVFIERGHAVLSRLTNAGMQHAEAVEGAVDELGRTVQYLYNARVIERGVSLPTWVWSSDKVSKALLSRQVQGIVFEDSPVASGLQDPGSQGVMALFALAVREPGAIQLAPPAIRLHHYARRLRNYLTVTSALAVAVLLALAGLAVTETLGAKQQADSLALVQAEVEQEKEALRILIDAAPTSADNVRESLATYQREIEAAPSLIEWLVAASRGFNATSSFQLNNFSWRTESANERDETGIGEASGCPQAFDMMSVDPEAPGGADARRTGLLLSGTVDQQLSLREALSARRTFESELNSFAGFVLDTQAAPIDISGEGAIRGSSGVEEDARVFDYCLTTPPRAAADDAEGGAP